MLRIALLASVLVLGTCAVPTAALVLPSSLRVPTPPTPPSGGGGSGGKCGFDGLDFSSLMGQDIVGSDGGSAYKYYLSLCGSLTSAAASTCTQIQKEASACQIQVTGGAQTFDIGNYDVTNPPTWSYVDDTQTAVQYNITGAVQCWANGGSAAPYVATVVLQCADTQGDMVVTSAPKSCGKTFTLPTPLACACQKKNNNKKIDVAEKKERIRRAIAKGNKLVSLIVEELAEELLEEL